MTQDEAGVADETLIRETEAALKNLSGSWPGPRGSSYNSQHEESPAFENLFDEKKANIKLSPSSASNSSSDNNTCSLKDVITLRDQHEETDDKSTLHITSKNFKIKQETDIDSYNKDNTKTKRKGGDSTHYQPAPDFNELVDDSSNELEIDMSDAASEKNEAMEKNEHNKEHKKYENDDPKSKYSNDPSPTTFHSFQRTSSTTIPSSSPFSTTSAFRPPQSTKSTPLTNLGPYPAEATFVGYPQAIGVSDPASSVDDKSKSLLQLKSSEVHVVEPIAIKSPEAASKQYTILQPAIVGSRATNALQDVARDGLPTVSAVSSSSSSTTDANNMKMIPAGALSPNSIGRGELLT